MSRNIFRIMVVLLLCCLGGAALGDSKPSPSPDNNPFSTPRYTPMPTLIVPDEALDPSTGEFLMHHQHMGRPGRAFKKVSFRRNAGHGLCSAAFRPLLRNSSVAGCGRQKR